MHPDERIRGFIGNVVAFAQADGGRVLTALPPRAQDLIGKVVIAFAGSEADLSKARLESLGVSLEDFKEAYLFLKDHNHVYSRVAWDEEGAADLAAADDVLGLPRALAACVRLSRKGKKRTSTVQHGPADAIEKGRTDPSVSVKRKPATKDAFVDVDEPTSDGDAELEEPVIKRHAPRGSIPGNLDRDDRSAACSSGDLHLVGASDPVEASLAESSAAPGESQAKKCLGGGSLDDDEASPDFDAEIDDPTYEHLMEKGRFEDVSEDEDHPDVVDDRPDREDVSDREDQSLESNSDSTDHDPDYEDDASETSQEVDEYTAAVADEDLHLNSDRTALHVEISLRKQELRRARLLAHEQEVRQSQPDTMSNYEAKGARDALRESVQQLQQDIKKVNVSGMEREIKAAEAALDGVRPPPNMEDTSVRAAWVSGRGDQATLLVPTKKNMEDMFDPNF